MLKYRIPQIVTLTPKFTKTELSEYWDSLKNFRDWYSVISTAEKKGREEGRKEVKRANARNLKKVRNSY